MIESRIYYLRPELAIMGDPTNDNKPVVVLRRPGPPNEGDWELIERALKLCKMKLGEGVGFRPDGLWYCPVEEVRDG